MPEIDDKTKIKWLISIRILFSFLLLGAAIIQQMGKSAAPMDRSLVVLYGLIAAIFLLSVVYSAFVKRVKNIILFAFIQTGIDTFFVTLIVFLTGGFVSVFSFLYLVVIIYSSMLLPMWGAMVIAALCSLQFGALVEMEYFGLLSPIGTNGNLLANAFDWSQIFLKLIITMTACFAVAFLSSLLSEQTRKTKEELRAMEGHVKRV
ncbi:MAG: two-component sensor histidine kinase, partial [Desulfobacterales bacterium]